MSGGSLTLRDAPVGGSGMLAIFCDLAAADQADFRPWLTQDMFPARIKIGFNACASFDRVDGDGPDFVTLYEMPSLGHLYGEPYQALRRVRTPRDAAYHEKFIDPARYTLSWVGPELGDLTAGMAPYIYVDRFNLAGADIQAFNMWFAGTYLPGLSQLPGLLRVRRYLAMEGTPRHVVLYELAEKKIVDEGSWQTLRTKFVNATSGLYERAVSAP